MSAPPRGKDVKNLDDKEILELYWARSDPPDLASLGHPPLGEGGIAALRCRWQDSGHALPVAEEARPRSPQPRRWRAAAKQARERQMRQGVLKRSRNFRSGRFPLREKCPRSGQKGGGRKTRGSAQARSVFRAPQGGTVAGAAHRGGGSLGQRTTPSVTALAGDAPRQLPQRGSQIPPPLQNPIPPPLQNPIPTHAEKPDSDFPFDERAGRGYNGGTD